MTSRFDLIFVLLDRPNEEMDRLLSEHVMNMHTGQSQTASAKRMAGQAFGMDADAADAAVRGDTQKDGAGSSNAADEERYREWQADQPRGMRLRRAAVHMEPVPPVLLRKYISYAREYVHPWPSPEASLNPHFYISHSPCVIAIIFPI